MQKELMSAQTTLTLCLIKTKKNKKQKVAKRDMYETGAPVCLTLTLCLIEKKKRKKRRVHRKEKRDVCETCTRQGAPVCLTRPNKALSLSLSLSRTLGLIGKKKKKKKETCARKELRHAQHVDERPRYTRLHLLLCRISR